MNLRTDTGFNFQAKNSVRINSNLRRNAQKPDTFSFCSKKQEDLNLYGVDYSMLTANDIKRSRTVHELILDKNKDIDISKDRDALICSRIKTAIHDAKKFTEEHPQFDYSDVCQELILYIIGLTDKELNGEIVMLSCMRNYQQKRDNYFNALMKSEKIQVPLEKEHIRALKSQDEEKILEDVKAKEMQAAINMALTELEPSEREVVETYYGLNGLEPQTLKKTGKKFNISPQRVRLILRYAERILRWSQTNKSLNNSLIFNDVTKNI